MGGGFDNGRAARLIGAGFGLVFVLVNAGPLPGPAPAIVRVLGLLAFVLAAARVARAPGLVMSPRPRALRIYWVSVVVEILVIVVGARLLAAHGHGGLGVALVAFVVGVHFLPLSWAFGEPSFAVLGWALIALGLLGAALGLLGSTAATALVSGVGSGAMLLAYAAGLLDRSPRPGNG